ncbi:MAG: hypothetical protein KGY67_03255 [Candidatus Thermoplasmatota archaeon]|nr:hypothetical protein [Candidatus Thermoplasmatota archaeon]
MLSTFSISTADETIYNEDASSQNAILKLPEEYQQELPAPGSTPDSWTYGFKRFRENINLFFTFDKKEKAEKQARLAELRLAEVKEMVSKGKTEYITDLISDYEKNIEESTKLTEIAQQMGENTTKIRELVAIATSQHVSILEEILQRVPEQAKSSIQHAINASEQENERSLSALASIQPEKAAEIHLHIAEKNFLKAQEEFKLENITNSSGDFIQEYEKQINKSKEIIETMKKLGKNTEDIEYIINNATSKHVSILSEIKENIPENATKAIEKALNVSRKGGEEALSAIEARTQLKQESENITDVIEKAKNYFP